MKTNRRALTLILTILTVLAVFTTFSCSGLFSSPDSKPGMGTLTIALPGSGARDATEANPFSQISSYYNVTILSNGEIIVPTQKVEPADTLTLDVAPGTYSVIVQGRYDGTTTLPDMFASDAEMFLFFNTMNVPFLIGRTDNVTIKSNETTPVSVKMFYPFTDSFDDDMDPIPANFDWGSGKLPNLTKEGCIFKGWFAIDPDGEYTIPVTTFPDTSTIEGREFYIATKFLEPREFLTGENYIYATQSGRGTRDGQTPENAASIETAFTKVKNNDTLYLLENINLGSNPSIGKSVTVIGAGGEDGWGKVTVTSSSQTYVVSFTQPNTSYTIWNVIIDGQGKRTGISANGTLILKDCIIQNGNSTSTSFGGGGIEISSSYTTVTLTGCQIKNCSATKKGGGIYSADTLNLNNCQIINCSSTGDGGGIYSAGTLNLNNCQIIKCSSTGDGGGMCIDNNCKLTMTDSTISNCSANRGGGISINCSSRGTQYPVSFTNCKITGCTGSQASIYASTNNPGNFGSNEDLTTADAWHTAVDTLTFFNGNAGAVTYSDN